MCMCVYVRAFVCVRLSSAFTYLANPFHCDIHTRASHPCSIHMQPTTFSTANALAPTYRFVNWFSDPIEDGSEPLNWFLLRSLQDTINSEYCGEHK